MPFSTISRRAFSIRARRSASEIGVALPGNGFKAWIDAGAGDPLFWLEPRCAKAGAPAIVPSAAAVEAPTKRRREKEEGILR